MIINTSFQDSTVKINKTPQMVNTVESIQTALHKLKDKNNTIKYTVPEIFLPKNNVSTILK